MADPEQVSKVERAPGHDRQRKPELFVARKKKLFEPERRRFEFEEASPMRSSRQIASGCGSKIANGNQRPEQSRDTSIRCDRRLRRVAMGVIDEYL